MRVEPQLKAKELFKRMKGFRVKNTHITKCCRESIENTIEVLQEMEQKFIDAEDYPVTTMFAYEIEYQKEILREVNKLY